MNIWIMWLLCLPAFAAFSLAMDKHHEQVLQSVPLPAQRWAWRSTGVVLMLLALLWSLHHWSTSVAIVSWLGTLTFAALCVGALLTYAPQRLRALALACLVLCLVLYLLH